MKKGTFTLLAAFILLLLTHGNLNAQIIYVTMSGAGDQDGSSWEDAFEGLQAALDVATDGNQIWVAAGTYTPTVEVGGSRDRYKTFKMKNGVAIYGGFKGNEESLNDRVIQDNPTILSGDLVGDDDYSEFPGTYLNDNSYHVIFLEDVLGLDNTAILDGFIIQGGKTMPGGKAGDQQGGGICISDNSPLFRNCVFQYNWAYSGGAAYIEGPDSDVVFTNCIFANNFSSEEGGGIAVDNGAKITLNNSTIVHNYANNGGGIFAFISDVEMNNSIIWDNDANNRGYQIYFNSTGYKSGSLFIINNSCYSDNENDVFDVYEDMTIDDYSITENPMFVNPDAGNYLIWRTSPCVDAGNNSFNEEPYDIRGTGYDRILDKDASKEAIIDIGAYEFNNVKDGDGLIIFVDLGRPDDSGDGLSWEQAKKTLQGALDIAGMGYEIWVKAGTYTPTYEYDLDEEPRCFHFRMKNGVAIYGGFVGDEDPEIFDLAARDFEANETILSGDLLGNDEFDVTKEGYQGTTGADNSYHVFYHPEEYTLDNTAILDGFTITGGNASYANYNPNYSGGGMLNYVDCAPTLTNLKIIANYAYYQGGGIGNVESSPVILNVVVEGNCAGDHGGGIFNNGSSPGMTDVIIKGNYAYRNGGGIYNNQGQFVNFPSTPNLTNVLIEANHANDNGGGMYNNGSSPILNKVDIIDNVAEKNGGGICNNQGDYAPQPSSPVFFNVIIDGNIATNSGGGIYSNNSTDSELYNVLITNNTAGLNGGGYFNNQSSETTLTNVTISKNNAGQYGGGVANANDGIVTINNSIVWGNIATGDGDDYGHEFYVVYDAATTLNYSCYSNKPGDVFVEDGGVKTNTFTATNNNTTNEPFFIDSDKDDFRVPGNSPCADAGLDDYFDIDEENDIRGEGYPRKVDKNDPNKVGTIDMGAYEFGPQDDCINPDNGGEIGEDQTICYGGTPAAFTSVKLPAGHFGDLEYQWQLNTISSTASFDQWEDAGTVTTTASYQHSTALTQTTWFRRLAKVECEQVGWASATASNVVEITVDPLPTATAVGSANICENGSHQVNGASADYGTIEWTHSGFGTLDNAGTLTPTYNAASCDAGNTVTLTLTVTSDNTCNPSTASAYYTIHVGSLGPVTKVNIIASKALNGQVKFKATPVNGGASPTYIWYKNNVKIDGVTGDELITTCEAGNEHYVVMQSSIPCTATAESNKMCTY